MKRIVVGLMILGLVIGGFLSCVLNGPADAVDQTQVDSVLATLSADGAFGQEISHMAEAGTVVDGWEYAAASETSLTFFTNGTWEFKVMEFEADDLDLSDSTQVAEDEDGDGTLGEGWVQTAGIKGGYSYNAETKVLTITYNGEMYDAANNEYLAAWNSDDNPIAGGEQVLASKTFVFKVFDDSLIDDADLATFIGADFAGETDLAETVLGVFEAGDVDGYDYYGSDYVVVSKVFSNADIDDPEYATTTLTRSLTVSETEVAFVRTALTYNETADTYVNGGAAFEEYVVDFPGYADGYWTDFSDDYVTRVYGFTFDATDGTYDWDSTYTTAYGGNDPGYTMLKMYGDGIIAY